MEKILDQARVLVVTENWNKQKRNNPTIPSAPIVKNDLLSGFPGGSVKDPSAHAGEPRVCSWIPEDSTCLRATKPVSHNYEARAPEPGSRNY